MYNNLFNVLDYVKLYSGKKPITSHPGNMEHSQIIMSLLTDLPYYETKSPQNLKNTAIRLDKTLSWTFKRCIASVFQMSLYHTWMSFLLSVFQTSLYHTWTIGNVCHFYYHIFIMWTLCRRLSARKLYMILYEKVVCVHWKYQFLALFY